VSKFRERERAREIAEQVVGVRVVAANRLLYVYSASRRTPIASATL
jgi:osmotically-inducible protein OsmY